MFNPEIQKTNIVSRRSFIISSTQLALLSVLGVRLYFLQVKEGGKYKDLAEGNRIRLIPIMPRRGVIKDRSGKVLAEGIPRYQLKYRPPKGSDVKKNFLKIAEIIKLPEDKINTILEKIANPKTTYPILIENFLEWENIAKLKVKSRDFKGIDVHFVESRSYPYGKYTCHITGYTGQINKYSDNNKRLFGQLLKHPDLRVGKTGIERVMQETLLGEPGIVEMEVDSRGRFINELGYRGQTRGKNLRLSIDVGLQEFVEKSLEGKGGIVKEGSSAVVLDVQTGDILAMSSVPDYDPNIFIKGVTQKELNDLYANRDRPFENKAISRKYPPGSTFKPVVAMAALQENLIHRGTTVFCSGHVESGGRTFHCWKKGGHGSVNLDDAIAQSCNVYFYEVGKLLGVEKIAKYARLMGLGTESGIPLPLESAGLVPDKRWKWKNYHEGWFEGETLNTSIGQGYMSATTLQLATVAARIASGGREVKPRLVLENNKPKPKFEYIEGISGRNVLMVQSAMVQVVNSYFGTAHRSRIDDPRHRMAGKTGTSQVAEAKSIKRHKRDFQETHSIFIGYAPVENPRFAISVVVEYGGSGSHIAAPIASKILKFAQEKYNI